MQGDIVVFSGGTYGHIGLVDATNSSSILTLEQNGATGDGDGLGGDEIRVRWIPKTRAVAYYRRKGLPTNGGNEMANRSQVNNIYKAVLHREGDKGGLDNYTGRDANSIVSEMLGSQEFANHQAFLTQAPRDIASLKENNRQKDTQIKVLNETLAKEKGDNTSLRNAYAELKTAYDKLKEDSQHPTPEPQPVDEQVVLESWFRRNFGFLINVFKKGE